MISHIDIVVQCLCMYTHVHMCIHMYTCVYIHKHTHRKVYYFSLEKIVSFHTQFSQRPNYLKWLIHSSVFYGLLPLK